MSESPVLGIERGDGVATLTLERPEARNALNRALRDALIGAFDELSRDEETDVVILTGSGAAFCAGLDLKELGQGEASESRDAVAGGDLIGAIHAFERPVIGAINGVAVTGGFELALACDVLIASENARFADTHARVGILPGWGLSQKLPRLVGSYRAKQISLTGNYLSAQQAERWGLVGEVVAPDALLPTCHALAQDMRSCLPEAVRAYKAMIDDGLALPFGDAMQLESKRSSEWMRSVSADDIASRRLAIQERGRAQKKD